MYNHVSICQKNYVFPKDIKMHLVDYIIPPKWVARIVNKNCKCSYYGIGVE